MTPLIESLRLGVSTSLAEPTGYPAASAGERGRRGETHEDRELLDFGACGVRTVRIGKLSFGMNPLLTVEPQRQRIQYEPIVESRTDASARSLSARAL
jgi:hypothetical protein